MKCKDRKEECSKEISDEDSKDRSAMWENKELRIQEYKLIIEKLLFQNILFLSKLEKAENNKNRLCTKNKALNKRLCNS